MASALPLSGFQTATSPIHIWEEATMATKTTTRTVPQWPTREVLVGCSLLALAGCGIGNLTEPDFDGGSRSRNFEGNPSEVRVTEARPRATPGGCEVDVTFTNVSRRTAYVGFDADILDSTGHRVTTRST